MPSCPFCTQLTTGSGELANEHAVAIEDAYPVTPGHMLIVTRRHVASYFELSEEEQAGLWQLLPTVRAALERAHHPDGFNLGMNDGAAAGQTVRHVHLHVIPRYEGDVPDPRGGVRWIIPERAPYWNRSGNGD